MRAAIIFVLGILFIVGCSSTELERLKETSNADHIGKITKIDTDGNRILVNELITNNDTSAIWLSIVDDTELLDSEGNTINFRDFKKGKLLEVWNSGGGFLSEPRQATAAKVILLK
ncbi:hypothetical protein AWH56_018785 [Anaerobacillus isosaccharinicus]|uniref:DUF3221 domain-containing protein n=1 Tax=Anaerobacillus isosaccharinicus TaxID=1532552 RepID=A0A1S2L4L0_9BACI|nr:hypothetical protein [Anaerobacillus isosaccharinicus]MBA5587047.1 hypothetical protein [Anaerobacillus isosaccharinicus]QOY34755.1 hypothetical protein AWH56_018785 [Anaerobacillus isosaccharinicus]